MPIELRHGDLGRDEDARAAWEHEREDDSQPYEPKHELRHAGAGVDCAHVAVAAVIVIVVGVVRMVIERVLVGVRRLTVDVGADRRTDVAVTVDVHVDAARLRGH